MIRDRDKGNIAITRLVSTSLNYYIQKSERENSENKSWLKQPNNLISVVAIVISLLSVAYGFWKDYTDGIAKDLQSLSAVVTDLTKIDSDMLMIGITDPNRQANLAIVLNNRRIALLAEADRLTERLGDQVPRSQLAVLGPEYFQINDYTTATKYFAQLTKAPSSPSMQLEAWRSLAVTYSFEGSDFTEKANGAFTKASQVFPDPKDAGSIMLKVALYEQWAQFEIRVSKLGDAFEHLAVAAEFSNRLTCPEPKSEVNSRLSNEIKQVFTMLKQRDPVKAKSAQVDIPKILSYLDCHG